MFSARGRQKAREFPFPPIHQPASKTVFAARPSAARHSLSRKNMIYARERKGKNGLVAKNLSAPLRPRVRAARPKEPGRLRPTTVSGFLLSAIFA
jgi:hypothetical protein